MTGSLTVIGSGIKFAAHMSLESKAYIEHADTVLILVSEPRLEEWIGSLNNNCTNLAEKFYRGDLKRINIYQQIVDFTIEQVKKNQNVCFVTYGHPGVFANAPHIAIQKAKALGYQATMTPGISAEDCLFADLAIDPGEHGCQQYEVTQFLVEQPKFEPKADLILWQIGSLGNTHVTSDKKITESGNKLNVLQKYLLKFYPSQHLVTMYIAAIYPGQDPIIETLALDKLHSYPVKGLETLFIPHHGEGEVNKEMLGKLGLSMEDISDNAKT
jgi:uncharacterized protein YabN with tetrapyrrole methylase and pyrophosphatase domain